MYAWVNVCPSDKIARDGLPGVSPGCIAIIWRCCLPCKTGSLGLAILIASTDPVLSSTSLSGDISRQCNTRRPACLFSMTGFVFSMSVRT